MNTITGYEFTTADNDVHLPSAIGIQNEAPMTMTAVYEGDIEDAILIASGLLPQLVERARKETVR